jgi:hypothetical protein
MKPIYLIDRATAQPVTARTLVVMSGPGGQAQRLAPGGQKVLDVHSERVVKAGVQFSCSVLGAMGRGRATYMRVSGGAWHLIEAEEGADDGVGP